MLLDRRLLFVTGKGGVGKTTVAAALAILGARLGKRTLVCEADGSGNLAALFEAGPISFTARQVQPSLFAMSMDTEEALKEYLGLQLKVPFVSRLGPLARAFDFIATAAPGVREILTVGKFGWEVRENHYDLVVVDAPASGHVVAQLQAPRAIQELVAVGLVREQTDWLADLLGDAATTGVVVVATPAEMPVVESLELIDRLGDTDVDVAAVVANRVLPELFGRGEEAIFESLRPEELGSGGSAVLDAARLAVSLRRTGAEHLTRLRAGLDPTLPVLYVPELFARSRGMRAATQVADHLELEL
jgi:anion-transporting  ArsA/GET3 family ATPase